MKLIELQRSLEEHRIWESFIIRIEQIMFPFHPGDVYVSTPSFEDPWMVRVDIQTLPNYPIFVRMGTSKHIVNQLKEKFDDIYVEPEEHIQLGLE